jgi:hypothetical protein
MKIRKEIIDMNSESGSGLIKKENELKTNTQLVSSVAKSMSDGITRWEKGGKVIKGDGSFAFCRIFHTMDDNENNLES